MSVIPQVNEITFQLGLTHYPPNAERQFLYVANLQFPAA